MHVYVMHVKNWDERTDKHTFSGSSSRSFVPDYFRFRMGENKCTGLCFTALWVKGGNRGNLKCLKVNDNFALIFHQQMFISFLSDAKLPKVYD